MRVTLGPAALRDVGRIAERLREESVRASPDFIDALEVLLGHIAEFPDSGKPTNKGRHRSLRVRGFPYLVFYRRLGANEVRILRVRHGRRRPLPS